MRRYQSALFLLILLCLPMYSHAQLWSGIIAPSRAIDWSSTGIPGGLPSSSWTQCGSTIVSGATAATINAALAACPANHYVLLGPGTFPGGINWTKSHVALRGSGADQTFIQGTGTTSCFGLGTTVGICSTDGTYANGPPGTIYNWTSGYSKGTTSITLSNTSGITANQTIVMLDQCDDGYTGAPCAGSSIDTGNYFVCSDQYSTTPTGCGSEGGTNAYRPHRAQIQAVVPTNVAGNTLTLPSQGLYAPQWRSGQTPQAWFVQPIIEAGIENLTIDATASGSDGVLIWNGYQCWVSGVRFVETGKSAVWLFQTVHSIVQNNYIYQSQDSDPYGIETEISADNLIINNIIQQNRSPIVNNGPTTGNVFAYNFTILDQTGSNGNWAFWDHSSGAAFDLWEGNIAGGFADDDIHGSHNMITRFRNRFTGKEDGNTGQITPEFEAAYNRYGNVIGEVDGTSGYDTTYSQVPFNNSTSIFTVGAGNPGTSPPVPNDSNVATTLMRWGNWDTVTNAVRWCGNSSDPGWTTTCSSTSEVPSGISPYGNPVPSNQILPASFYSGAKPAWWPSAKAWPPIGPDVTGGNIANVGGHAYTIPAQDCYLNVMGGPADGSGGALSFNANTCYPQGGDPPAPPSNLTAVPQ